MQADGQPGGINKHALGSLLAGVAFNVAAASGAVAVGCSGASRTVKATTAASAAATAAAVGAWLGSKPGCSAAWQGWWQDRMENLRLPSLGQAKARRLLRLRRWRQSLSAREAADWVAAGAAGPELRSIQDCPYDPRFEAELVERQRGGPTLQKHEAVWVKRADGDWALVEAVLDTDNPAGIIMPQQLAFELGYVNEEGEPVERWAGEGHEIWTSTGQQVLPSLKPLTFSIAGSFFTEPACLKPTLAQHERGTQSKKPGTDWADVCCMDVPGRVGDRTVRLSVHVVRLLEQQGIRLVV